MAEQGQRAKAPKTPLKRVSRNSLRTRTLSTSQSNNNPLASTDSLPSSSDNQQNTIKKSKKFRSTDHYNNPNNDDDEYRSRSNFNKSLGFPSFSSSLESLSPLFSDLSDSVTDLNINLSNLDSVCKDLDGFNHAFSSFILGLRVNAYLTEFDQAPKLESFKFFLENEALKQNSGNQKGKEKEEYEEKPGKSLSNNNNNDQASSVNRNDDSMESSFFNNTQNSINNNNSSSSNFQNQSTSKPDPNNNNTKKKKANSAKNFTSSSKLQQKQLLKFSELILSNLPIKFREQQPHRKEMEYVISCLRLNGNGLSIKDIVKLEPTLALHRVRECCTNLVNSKKAIKINNPDGVFYKLSV